MNEQMNEWMNEWMNKWMNEFAFFSVFFFLWQRYARVTSWLRQTNWNGGRVLSPLPRPQSPARKMQSAGEREVGASGGARNDYFSPSHRSPRSRSALATSSPRLFPYWLPVLARAPLSSIDHRKACGGGSYLQTGKPLVFQNHFFVTKTLPTFPLFLSEHAYVVWTSSGSNNLRSTFRPRALLSRVYSAN